MKRAAIYARYSDENSNDRSIEDQIALCRSYAERNGYAVAMLFEDRAISGASIHGRAGIQSLMQAGRAHLFDAVICEGMSRIGRDQEDRAAIRKRLNFQGIEIVTPSDGVVTPMIDGLRAIIDTQYLEDLKVSVRRGLAGVVRDGRHAGGRAYGYRPVLGRPGELEIVDAEAAVVRRIFADYAAGRTPRAIAAALNREGVPAPRGPTWSAIVINGNLQRGSGILLNDLYRGVIVWNRVRMIKDPDTGKRISRANPKAEHHTSPAPQLRIVDDETWNAAQARKAERHKQQPAHGRKPPRLLSGLLRCGCCSGGMTSLGRDSTGKIRIGCSAARERGNCDNREIRYLEPIERTVLAGLRERLADRAYFAIYVRKYNEERGRLAKAAGDKRGQLERRAGEIGRELGRAVEAILKGTAAADTLAGPIRRLEFERDQVAAELAALDQAPTVIALHPKAIDRYQEDAERLAEILARDDDREKEQLITTLRRLVQAVVIHPRATGPRSIEVSGRLAELVRAPAFTKGSLSGGLEVAEARYRHSPTNETLFSFWPAAA